MIKVYARPETRLDDIAAWFRDQNHVWLGLRRGPIGTEFSYKHDCLVWAAEFPHTQADMAAHFKLVFE